MEGLGMSFHAVKKKLWVQLMSKATSVWGRMHNAWVQCIRYYAIAYGKKYSGIITKGHFMGSYE